MVDISADWGIHFRLADNRERVVVIDRRENTVIFDGYCDETFSRWLWGYAAGFSEFVAPPDRSVYVSESDDLEYEFGVD